MDSRPAEEIGFGVVPCTVSSAALAWANQAVENWIALQSSPLTGQEKSPPQPSGPVQDITAVASKLGAVALYLMGLPALAEIACKICGTEAVPSHDWMVIKNPGIGQEVAWHQDFVHGRRHPAITIGIHLDDTPEDSLRVIAGTQWNRQDLCAITARLGYDSPEATKLNVKAGSLVWHDVMMVHGSPALPPGAAVRKTYYVEFRSLAALREHHGFPESYVSQRRQLFKAARQLHRRLGTAPSGGCFDLLTADERDLINTLQNSRVGLDLANYCTSAPGSQPTVPANPAPLPSVQSTDSGRSQPLIRG